MAKALRDAWRRKNLRNGDCSTSGIRDWMEVGAGVALAIAAEPIHEVGHAVAARLVSGVWPCIGLWSVHPTVHFDSTRAILTVLAAGEVAVVCWWAVAYLAARRWRARRWVLIGPAFMAALGLLNWLAAALLTPLGYANLGASDAGKFMSASGVSWYELAMITAAANSALVVVTFRCLTCQGIEC